MPDYKITISNTAQKQLDNLPDSAAEKVIVAIKGLAHNPRPSGFKKLKGREGYRIRKGNYRILYEIFDSNLIVDVIALGHRKNIYK
jgi:mRNA interferase RelE/StbE